jgi:hypothetical protein
MKLKQDTFLFNAEIATDRFLNFLAGGSFQECFSTRAFIRSQIAKPRRIQNNWIKVRNLIDRMFWDGHCEDSFKWEMKLKQTYITAHKYLIKKDSTQ